MMISYASFNIPCEFAKTQSNACSAQAFVRPPLLIVSRRQAKWLEGPMMVKEPGMNLRGRSWRTCWKITAQSRRIKEVRQIQESCPVFLSNETSEASGYSLSSPHCASIQL